MWGAPRIHGELLKLGIEVAESPVAEMVQLLAKARKRLSADQIWVNPDCGLKARKWEEVRPALVNMVEAARHARASSN